MLQAQHDLAGALECFREAERINRMAWFAGPVLEVPVYRDGVLARHILPCSAIDVQVSDADPLGHPVAAAYPWFEDGERVIKVVDREYVFVGSFNWDPRSIDINTELGVIIESSEMGDSVGKQVDAALPTRTYEVVLNEDGNLRWIDNAGDEPIILTKEPDASWWRRTKAQMGRIVPMQSQL